MGATAGAWAGSAGVFRAGGVIALQRLRCVFAACAIDSMPAMTPLRSPVSG